MNTVILTIILVPIVEIYLFIKIGSQIGAFNTISLILENLRLEMKDCFVMGFSQGGIMAFEFGRSLINNLGGMGIISSRIIKKDEKPNNLFVADFIGSPAINLIKGEVTDKSSIKLKSQELPHQKNNLSPNQKVVYGIRPTDVKIVENSNVKAEVILVETTGSETHIIAMLDDNEFRIVQAGGRTSIKNGEKVSLEFDISKAHTFDQTTTKRID